MKLGSDDRIHKTTICILTDGKDNAKASVPLAAREKCIFPMGCQVVFGSRWLLLGEVGCKEGAAPKTPLCLTASRLPQSPVVCMDDTDLSANTC